MKSTEHWLVHEHTQFEVMLNHLHAASDIADWWAIEHYFSDLVKQLKVHMAQEEEILFPAYDKKFESARHESRVTTKELVSDHNIIVAKFRDLEAGIFEKNTERVIKCVSLLELLMIEHNEKEEQIFLPFASHLLFEDRDQIEKKMINFEITDASRDWSK